MIGFPPPPLLYAVGEDDVVFTESVFTDVLNDSVFLCVSTSACQYQSERGRGIEQVESGGAE